MRPRVSLAFVGVALLAGCGGGDGGTTSPSVTAPTTAVTMAEFAPALGETVASTLNTALQSGTAATPPTGIAELLRRAIDIFTPVPLHAQTSNFVANCSRGGNVNIRYTGLRPVVMTGTEAVYSRCGSAFRNRDVFFSGTIRLGGYWTAGDPGPFTAEGTVNVEEIGAALLNGSVTGSRYNGTVAGVTVGTQDTAPPPSPNTCPGVPTPSSITVPAGGGTYQVVVPVGATCPWSVTSGPAWVTVSPGGGRGAGTVTVTVSANGAAARSGTLQVNGQNVTIGQSAAVTTPPSPNPPAAGQDAMLGQWQGSVSVNQPCGTLPGTYTWRATMTRSGSAYSMALFTTFSFETRNIPIPVLGSDRTFEFSWNDPELDLTLRLRGTFAADWQSLSGSVNGTIICNPSNPPQNLSGQWQGRRTGS